MNCIELCLDEPCSKINHAVADSCVVSESGHLTCRCTLDFVWSVVKHKCFNGNLLIAVRLCIKSNTLNSVIYST